MIKKKNAFFIIILICISIISSGCASRKRLIKKDHRYVSLRSVCSEYNLSWSWDGISKIIRINKRYNKARLYQGSSLIWFNNKIFDLGSQVLVKNGCIMVPESFADLFTGEKEISEHRILKKIVIDPGHGGKDPGAMRGSNRQEKNIVLDVALRLKQELANAGFDVIMTRDTDVFVPLPDRAEIANRLQADLFISVHANAANSSKAKGFEAFYLDEELNGADKAQNLRESMEIAYSVAGNLEQMIHLETRYIKGAKFRVLKVAQMPAVLLELGYITNNIEGALLDNPDYRQMLSEAVARGIFRYQNN